MTGLSSQFDHLDETSINTETVYPPSNIPQYTLSKNWGKCVLLKKIKKLVGRSFMQIIQQQ